jgi:hypothetical protein
MSSAVVVVVVVVMTSPPLVVELPQALLRPSISNNQYGSHLIPD